MTAAEAVIEAVQMLGMIAFYRVARAVIFVIAVVWLLAGGARRQRGEK